MVTVDLSPTKLFLDQHSDIAIRLSNKSDSPCTNIVFSVKFPVQILLLKGLSRIVCSKLEPGQSITHIVQVKPKRTGTWSIISSNFSYRNSLGKTKRIDDLKYNLIVDKKQILPPSKLDIILYNNNLTLGEWEIIKGKIINLGSVTLDYLTISFDGPVIVEPSFLSQKLGPVCSYDNIEFQTSIRPRESGKAVPIRIKANYFDEFGRCGEYISRVTLNIHTQPLVSKESKTIIKILFLAANPVNSTQLRLDEEVREIDRALQQSDFKNKFDIKQHWAVRTSDLQGYLLRYKPNIVHFSGHGSEQNKIILEDSQGYSKPVSIGALSKLFNVLKENIRCVVLNACFSEFQAEAIAQHIDCVIGMSKAIQDSSAINFAAAFYQALGFGKDLKTAFDLGCVQIDLEGLGEQEIPKLFSKKGDPKYITLI